MRWTARLRARHWLLSLCDRRPGHVRSFSVLMKLLVCLSDNCLSHLDERRDRT